MVSPRPATADGATGAAADSSRAQHRRVVDNRSSARRSRDKRRHPAPLRRLLLAQHLEPQRLVREPRHARRWHLPTGAGVVVHRNAHGVRGITTSVPSRGPGLHGICSTCGAMARPRTRPRERSGHDRWGCLRDACGAHAHDILGVSCVQPARGSLGSIERRASLPANGEALPRCNTSLGARDRVERRCRGHSRHRHDPPRLTLPRLERAGRFATNNGRTLGGLGGLLRPSGSQWCLQRSQDGPVRDELLRPPRHRQCPSPDEPRSALRHPTSGRV